MISFLLPRLFQAPSRLAALAATIGLCLASATSAVAQQAGPLQVEVIERSTGRSLPVYTHRGQYWVEGLPGAHYGVRVINRSGERVLAVMSVDGVNVLTGETAATDQAGYVLDPWQSSQINGWRKSSNQIAAFHFTALPHSYAARTGRPDDVGVIGLAVFHEYRRQPIYEHGPYGYKRERSPNVEGAKPMQEKGRHGTTSAPLGTGHGRAEYSHSQATRFQRASPQPDAVLQLRYDSHENLVAMGVIRDQHWHAGRPDAFPAEEGYVPDPPPYWR